MSDRACKDGFILSWANLGQALSIYPGAALDSTNTLLIVGGGDTKTFSGPFLPGDGGSCGNASQGWYHVFAGMISGACDFFLDTSIVAANKPAGTTAFRRIGSILVSGGIARKFFQHGDTFVWDDPFADVFQPNPGTLARVTPLTVPPDVRVVPLGAVNEYNPSTDHYTLWTSLEQTDWVPSALRCTAAIGGGSPYNNSYSLPGTITTDTAGQIRYRLSASGVNDTIAMLTLGWRDFMERDQP